MINAPSVRNSSPRAFSLVELLIVMAIISIIAAMSMSAMQGALEEGKKSRARTVIAKIDDLIMEKYNSYRMRTVPIRLPPGTPPVLAAQIRLNAIRELQRMELPDHYNDIDDPPAKYAVTNGTLTINVNQPGAISIAYPAPSLQTAYKRFYTTKFSSPDATKLVTNENAECLFMILSQMKDGERSAISFFLPSEIGDTDSDGIPEILDPWGTAIRFHRWAPGYSVAPPLGGGTSLSVLLHLGEPPVTTQVADGNLSPDPFDPLKVDPRWRDQGSMGVAPLDVRPFAMRPLVYSAGPDRKFDFRNGYYDTVPTNTLHYNVTYPPNDPYHVPPSSNWIGAVLDLDNDGLHHADNITNHYLTVGGGN